MPKNKIYYWYPLLVIFLFTIFYISWFVSVLENLLSIFIYSLIFYLLYIIWKKIRNKKYLDFADFFPLFIYKFCLFIFLIVSFLFVFVYYNNYLNPASMPQYALSNWKKIIIFQSMSHIASPSFYENVKNNIKEFKEKSWVLFYEWVKVENQESLDKFNQALGFEFWHDLYDNMSKLYDWVAQNNDDFLWIVNNLDFNVDLSMDEVIKIYEEKNMIANSWAIYNGEVLDVNQIIDYEFELLNPREKKLLIEFNKALLNLVIRNDSNVRELLKSNLNSNLSSVILDERNKNLVENINSSEYNKIFIIYWALHFDWVYKLLKENDSEWEIIDTKLLYPLK